MRLKIWDGQNHAKVKASKRAHYERNKDVMDARSNAWRLSNIDKHKAAVALWIENNRAHVNAYNMRRHARKKYQTPADADLSAIRSIYDEAIRLTQATGIRHEVDHKIPLSRGGLHHHMNLQVLTKSENARKRDRLL